MEESPSRPTAGGPTPSNVAPEDLGERLAAQSRHLRLVCAHLAGSALRARVELDDLVQEVFLRAIRSAEVPPCDHAGDRPLARWLTRLARNTVIDAVRAARAAKRDGATRRLALSDWSRAGALASPLAGPATRVLARETHEGMLDAFEALSAEHRRVLGLRQFEGLSARETAGRMARSEAAVNSLYRRALGAWQSGLERLNPDPDKKTPRIGDDFPSP